MARISFFWRGSYVSVFGASFGGFTLALINKFWCFCQFFYRWSMLSSDTELKASYGNEDINPTNATQCIPCEVKMLDMPSPEMIPQWCSNEDQTHDMNVACKYSKNNFLTPMLISEIQNHYPSRDSITKSDNNSRNKLAFASHCEQLFPIGRIFYNREQFCQAVRMFCEKWAIHVRHESKSMKCFYHNDKRSYKKNFVPTKSPETHLDMNWKNNMIVHLSLGIGLCNTVRTKKRSIQTSTTMLRLLQQTSNIPVPWM